MSLEPDEQRFYEWFCTTGNFLSLPMEAVRGKKFPRIVNSLWREGLLDIRVSTFGHSMGNPEVDEIFGLEQFNIILEIKDPTEIVRHKNA